MANLTCPACGSVYALESVRNVDRFACAVCTQLILVPMAGPSAARKARDEAPERAPIPAPTAAPPSRAVLPRPPAPPVRAVPAAAPQPARSGSHTHVRPGGHMKPMRGLSTALLALLAADVFVTLFSILEPMQSLDTLEEIRRGAEVDPAKLAALDEGDPLAVALVFIAIALGIAFIVWLGRAHSNLRAARVERLEYGSGWAIGGWFVPILNLWRPYQVTAEVWKASAFLAGRTRVASWSRAPVDGIVKAWWFAWIVAGGVAQTAIWLRRTAFTVDRAITAEWVDVASSVASILSAILAIELVRRVTDMQERARSRLLQARREATAG